MSYMYILRTEEDIKVKSMSYFRAVGRESF